MNNHSPSSEEKVYFSIMICCYNSEKYIKETIESIIKQTYSNWEIVIINDGSTDSTEEIILKYISKGYNIKYHYQSNKGFASARNKAVQLANYDWIAIIDHDDICMPNRLNIQAKQILMNPNAKLFFANTIHFRDNNKIITTQFEHFYPQEHLLKKGRVKNYLLQRSFIDSESVVFNKEAAINAGLFNSKLKYIVDQDFYIRMGEKYNFFCSNDIVSKWRLHPNQATVTMSNTAYKETIYIFRKYFLKADVDIKTKRKMLFNLTKRTVREIINKINKRIK